MINNGIRSQRGLIGSILVLVISLEIMINFIFCCIQPSYNVYCKCLGLGAFSCHKCMKKVHVTFGHPQYGTQFARDLVNEENYAFVL